MTLFFSLLCGPCGVPGDLLVHFLSIHLPLAGLSSSFAAWSADWRTQSGCFLGVGFALFAWIGVECVKDWQSRAPLREAQKVPF